MKELKLRTRFDSLLMYIIIELYQRYLTILTPYPMSEGLGLTGLSLWSSTK
jgi:hypothetical protein